MKGEKSKISNLKFQNEKKALVVRARDLERLGKEFFPHLIQRQAREMIETLFGFRGHVLIVKP